MKKKVMVVAMLFITVVFNGLAGAVQSTQAEFNTALKVSVESLSGTARYAEPINAVDYRGAFKWRDKCYNQSKLIDFWQDNLTGQEAQECLMKASIIVTERGHALSYFISAVNAFKAGNRSQYDMYITQMCSYIRNAERERQAFSEKYGY